MYKLWCLAIYGYIPKWNIISEGRILSNSGQPIGRYYIMQCEQTGKIKRINTALPGYL